MRELFIAYCAILGLLVGSFLNVVIYRVPRQLSIIKPRSACPSCSTPIRGRDNIPLLSWLWLKGRCRSCGDTISIRYPLIELLTAVLFAAAAIKFGANWALPAYLVLLAGLVALSFIDIEFLLLPKVIVWPLTALVTSLFLLAALLTHELHQLLIAVTCAVLWFLLFFLLNFASPRLLGFGDVRLSLVLGLSLGWLGWREVVLGFFAANLIGLIVAVALIVTKRIQRDQQIPYGVFLAAGTIFAIFAGSGILSLLPGAS